MRRLLKTDTAIALYLVAFSALVNRAWLNFHIFSNADYGYTFFQSFKHYVLSAWFGSGGMGSADVLLWRAPYVAAINFFFSLGWPSNVADKLLIFWPLIIVVPLAPYLLLRHGLKFGKLASVVGSVVFTYNSYFLAISTQGHIFLTLAGALIVAGLAALLVGFDRNSRPLFVVSACLLAISGFFDLRLLFIGGMLIGMYVIYWGIFQSRIIPWKNLLLFMGIIGGLHLFWLLPTLMFGSGSSTVLHRSLFGGEFWSILHAIALHHPFWSPSEVVWFQVHDVPLYYFALPLLAGVGLYMGRADKKVVFFALVAFVGIFLTKQTGDPFGATYLWLYDHVPGFSAFREATKFYFLIALGYCVLIGSLVHNAHPRSSLSRSSKRTLLWHRSAYYLAPVVIACLFLPNVLGPIAGKLTAIQQPRTIPGDYSKFQAFIEEQPEFFRTYWIPSISRWSYYDNLHPRMNAVSVLNGQWASVLNPVPKGNAKFISPESKEAIMATLQKDVAPQLLAGSAVKYVVLPIRDLRNGSDVFKDYGDRPYYQAELAKLPYLKPIDIGTKELLVYENLEYKPPATAFNSVSILDSASGLLGKQAVANYLGQSGQDFIAEDLASNGPKISISNLFDALTSQNIASQNIQTSFNAGENAKLIQKQVDQLNYVATSTSLTLTTSSGGTVVLDGKPINAVPPAASKQYPLQAGQSYYLATGDTLMPLRTGSHKIGAIEDALSLYRIDKPGPAPSNNSFEQGLWSAKPKDCDPYDQNSLLLMKLITGSDLPDGQNALSLQSNRHSACTDQVINVEPNSALAFGFDYQVKSGSEGGYRLEFNDPAHTRLEARVPSRDDRWHQFLRLVTVPPGATKLTYTLIAPEPMSASKTTEIIYDRVQLQQLTKISEISPAPVPRFSSTPIPAGQHQLTHQEPGLNLANLIPNPSFEQGSWKEAVDDCSAYDSDSQISQNITKAQASHGEQALVLKSKRHLACTGPGATKVKENTPYHLSFDYQGGSTQAAGYSITFNDGKSPIRSEHFQPSRRTTGWQHFSKVIRIPPGATNITLLLYAYPSSDGTQAAAMYDNLRMVEVPELQDRYYLASEAGKSGKLPATVTATSMSPTNMTVKVQGAQDSFYLRLSTAYHPKWQLNAVNQKTQDMALVSEHYNMSGGVNTWYIDIEKICRQPLLCRLNTDGTYDIQLKATFAPERGLIIGTALTGAVALSCGIYLLLHWVRRHRKKSPPSLPPPTPSDAPSSQPPKRPPKPLLRL